MKQIILILFSFFSLSSFAQTKGSGKLYAYKQSVTPGIIRKEISEEGIQTVTPPRQRTNYYIYLSTSSRAYPSELWINGEAFSASVQKISKTPVEHVTANVPSNPTTKVLVPKTAQQIIQLTPMPLMSGKKLSSKGKSFSGSHEIVVVYKQNGKFYYQKLAKFSSLETAAMQ